MGVGFNVATTTKVGNAVGEKSPNKAKNNVICAFITAILVTIIEEIILWKCRFLWASLFTNNELLESLMLRVLAIYFFLLVPDNL